MDTMIWGALAIGALVVINFILDWRSRRASQRRQDEIASSRPPDRDAMPE